MSQSKIPEDCISIDGPFENIETVKLPEDKRIECRTHGLVLPMLSVWPEQQRLMLRCPHCIEEEDMDEDNSVAQPPEVEAVAEEIPQHEPGAKLDTGKPDGSLLQYFSRSLLEVARVGTYGAQKYTRGGWLEVPNGKERYSAAMMRHWLAENHEGPFDLDPLLAEYGYEGKIRHKAQVAWNALAALELELIEEDADES